MKTMNLTSDGFHKMKNPKEQLTANACLFLVTVTCGRANINLKVAINKAICHESTLFNVMSLLVICKVMLQHV